MHRVSGSAVVLALLVLALLPQALAAAAPHIQSVSPSSGPVAGGTTVTIGGQHLSDATGVTFGGQSASFTVVGSQIQATTPSGTAGPATLRVTGPGGSDTSSFTYTASPPPPPPPSTTSSSPPSSTTSSSPPPSTTSSSPPSSTTPPPPPPSTTSSSAPPSTTSSSPPPSTTSSSAPPSATSSSPAPTSTSASPTTSAAPPPSRTSSSPASPPGGTTRAPQLPATQPAPGPSIRLISPVQGPQSGGTEVTIHGGNLDAVTGVAFGGVASVFAVQGSDALTAVAPAGEVAGTVALTVKGPNGVISAWYTYVAAPPDEPARARPADPCAVAITPSAPGERIVVPFPAPCPLDSVVVQLPPANG
ncbi:MAG: IPT/TIG domain-containing protein, partial [Halobacteriales archaeon]|nr:IPT/TIG domain-containing protein [Halobacteriales archaeon]